MRCAEVLTPSGIVELVPLGIANLDEQYEGLHKQAPSGWAVHAAYSDDRFKNKLHDADDDFYYARAQKWFGEIFHDTIEGRESDEGEACPGEGFLPVTYTINPGRTGLLAAKIWLPPEGYSLPVKDNKAGYRFFRVVDGKTADGKDVRMGTLVPEKVVSFSQRGQAEKAFSEFDLPQEEISGFYRLDDYRGQIRFGGRDCSPYVVVGRFRVYLGRVPSTQGSGWMGSRPAYAEKEIVMRAGFPQETKAE